MTSAPPTTPDEAVDQKRYVSAILLMDLPRLYETRDKFWEAIHKLPEEDPERFQLEDLAKLVDICIEGLEKRGDSP